MILTTSDDQKWQYGDKTGNTKRSDTVTDRMTISTSNLGGFDHVQLKKLTPSDCDKDRQPEMAI